MPGVGGMKIVCARSGDSVGLGLGAALGGQAHQLELGREVAGMREPARGLAAAALFITAAISAGGRSGQNLDERLRVLADDLHHHGRRRLRLERPMLAEQLEEHDAGARTRRPGRPPRGRIPVRAPCRRRCRGRCRHWSWSRRQSWRCRNPAASLCRRRAAGRSAGLTSRWTMPCSWASSRPVSSCVTMSSFCATDSGGGDLQPVREALPAQELHRDVRRPGVLGKLEDRDDVPVLVARRRAALPGEKREAGRLVGREVAGHHLDGDLRGRAPGRGRD